MGIGVGCQRWFVESLGVGEVVVACWWVFHVRCISKIEGVVLLASGMVIWIGAWNIVQASQSNSQDLHNVSGG